MFEKFEAILKTLSGEEADAFKRTFQRVLKETTDEVKALLAAIGAVRRLDMGLAVKSIKSTEDGTTIGGWAVTFGGPGDLADADRPATFFHPQTMFFLEYYPNAPLWEEHGFQGNGVQPIGHRTDARIYPQGIWLEHFIPATVKNYKGILDGIQKGEYSYSSDTLRNYMLQGLDAISGQHNVWPLAGCSITRTPAEPGNGPIIPIVKTSGAEGMLDAKGADTLQDPVSAHQKEGQDIPAKATLNQVQPIKSQGEWVMLTQEQLAALATFLGVEATEEAVRNALAALLAQMTGEATPSDTASMSGDGNPIPEEQKMGGEAPTEEYEVDAMAMKAAFGLGEDANDDALVAHLRGILDLLTPEARERKSLDYSGLSAFSASARNTPVNRVDYNTRPRTSPSDKKSVSISAPNFNRGAEAPTFASLVEGMLHGNAKAIKAASGNSGSNVRGGIVVRREMSQQILEPLVEKEIVMAMGAEVVPMDGIETLTVTKDLDSGEAYWAGEGQAVTEGKVKLGTVNLSLKELVGEFTVSARQIRNTANFEAMLQDRLRSKLSRKMDKSFLFGSGAKPNDGGSSGAEPLGLLNLLPSGQVIPLGTGGNGAKPTMSTFGDMVKAIKGRNVEDAATWGWAMGTGLHEFVSDLADAQGRPMLRENWAGREYPTLKGIARYESNQIPTTSDLSTLFLGDWQYAVVGMGADIELVVDESVLRRQRLILIQAVAMVDFGVYYKEAFEVRQNVKSA